MLPAAAAAAMAARNELRHSSQPCRRRAAAARFYVLQLNVGGYRLRPDSTAHCQLQSVHAAIAILAVGGTLFMASVLTTGKI